MSIAHTKTNKVLLAIFRNCVVKNDDDVMVWLWCRGVCIYCKNRHNLVFQQKTMAIFRNCVLVLLREIYNDLYQANYKINMYWMYNSSLVMWFFPRYMSPMPWEWGWPIQLCYESDTICILYCIVLHCTVLDCTVLDCTELMHGWSIGHEN